MYVLSSSLSNWTFQQISSLCQIIHGVRSGIHVQAECSTIQWHPTRFPPWRSLTLASHKIGQNGFGVLNASVKHQALPANQKRAKQVNTLVYSMGDKADDILQSFNLTEADQKKYSTVKDKFERYFVKRRNTIFERAKFNKRKQEDKESVDEFITDVYCLAEHCGYAALHDE